MPKLAIASKTVAALAVLFSASILVGCSKKPTQSANGDVEQPMRLMPSVVLAGRTTSNARAVLTRANAELDTTHARLEHIEGTLHLVNALDAWDLQQHKRAGLELQRSADNLERAAKFLHLELDARALAATSGARAAGRRLQQSAEVGANEFWQLTDELDTGLRSLGARFKRKS